jgi:hypothetical protein
LNLETENYFCLGEVGSRIWEVLSEQKTIEAAIPILLEKFNVDKEVLKSDIEDLVKSLVAEKLVSYAK